MFKTFYARKETACYYVVTDECVWLAWVWDGQDDPPLRLAQIGYRWEKVADSVG